MKINFRFIFNTLLKFTFLATNVFFSQRLSFNQKNKHIEYFRIL